MKVSVHVDTDGSTAVSLKQILGLVSGKPNGGTSVQPVRKTKISPRVGVKVGDSARLQKIWDLSHKNKYCYLQGLLNKTTNS